MLPATGFVDGLATPYAGGAIEVAAGGGSVLVLRLQLEGGSEGEARSVLGANLLKGSIVIA